MKNSYLKSLFSVLVFLSASLSWADLKATVDRSEIADNESLQLVVRYSGQPMVGEPDFSGIERHFDIVSNSRQQQYSVINGNSESFTDWKMLLLPKRSGELEIPSLTFKGSASKPIKINVQSATSRANSSTQNTKNQAVYTETEVDKASAYLQEQVMLTVRLITSVQLQDFSLTELEIPNTLIQKAAENQYQKVINGINHLVVEIKFALFPQQIGKVEIPPLRMGAYEVTGYGQFGGFPTRGKRILRLTEGKTIDILPKPDTVSADQWMPSSNLSISDNWSNGSANLKVGEPVTRTITINAQGLTAAQIQPLPEQPSDNYKLYPDQPRLSDQAGSKGILGQRIETYAIVPSKAGTLVMPPIQIQWWDTTNNKLQTSTLAAKTLSVLAADPIDISADNSTGTLQTQLNDSPSTETSIPNSPQIQKLATLYRWSLLLNGLLITALIVVLYFQGFKVKPMSAESNAAELTAEDKETSLGSRNLRRQFKLIKRQASNGNLSAMRAGILKWGSYLFPEQAPESLKQLGKSLGNAELIHQFSQLDQHLFNSYASADEFNTAELIANLKRYRRPVTKQESAGGLKPLYPDQ